MPTKTAELLGKVPDSKQYPVAAPWGIAGAHSSSPSESWNHAALAARNLTFVAAAKSILDGDSARFMRNKEAALGCEATLPPRVNEAQVGQKLSASRISRSHVTFLDNTKSVAMVSVSTNPKKKVRVDLNEVRNGGPAACDNLRMVLTKIPCSHAHAAAVAADVNMMHIICPELKKAHWKEQYEGTEFPLPSEAQIERHANLINTSICLPPGLKRPNGRPKSTKRKQGFMDKQGSESGTFPRSSAVLVGIFRYGNGRIIFFEFRTTGSNILNFGTTGSDLISIWERQDQFF